MGSPAGVHPRDLAGRLDELTARVEAICGVPLVVPEDVAADVRLELLCAEVASRLEAERGDGPAAVGRLVLELAALRADVVQRDLRRRVEGLQGVQAALAALHEVADPGRLYDAATAALCRHCDFDRVILFGVEGDELVALSVHFTGEPEWAARVLELGRGAGRPQLSESILETEMLRRRAPALVQRPDQDPRATRPLVEATQTTSYVAAPILPAGRVIGFLHADHHTTGRAVDEVDRDVLWAFAEGYGYAVERTLLRAHLDEQRRRLRELGTAMADVGEDICNAEMALDRSSGATARATTRALTGALQPPAGAQFNLSPRELEVMELLAAGETNSAIARRIYVSESTVKVHVKSILRKLGAANRAEAAARFMAGAQT
ncbi:MAG TPA: LuxR C-terminal-related transcriptional regulator [Baekduia sp.]|nr:LuxR C-terminal-related transcriptional regulator [Baekduia sp.]